MAKNKFCNYQHDEPLINKRFTCGINKLGECPFNEEDIDLSKEYTRPRISHREGSLKTKCTSFEYIISEQSKPKCTENDFLHIRRPMKFLK